MVYSLYVIASNMSLLTADTLIITKKRLTRSFCVDLISMEKVGKKKGQVIYFGLGCCASNPSLLTGQENLDLV
jgi:hypothetical protein